MRIKKKRYYVDGKRSSKGEKEISDILKKYNIFYQKEKTFANCVSARGNCLRFDFYLTDFNILIEYQGQHHYNPVNKYQRAKRVYEQTINHDIIKKNFAAANNIKLVEISHKEYDKIEKIITEIMINYYTKENKTMSEPIQLDLFEMTAEEIAALSDPFAGATTGEVYGTPLDISTAFDKSGSNVINTEVDDKLETFFS